MLIETLVNLGIPIFPIPELSLVIIWNESTVISLYREYSGELEQIDLRTIEMPFEQMHIGQVFWLAYQRAKDWAEEIRQADNESQEG